MGGVEVIDNHELNALQTPTGEVRRNGSQLNINPSITDTQPIANGRSPILTRSHTGTVINPPDRLIYD